MLERVMTKEEALKEIDNISFKLGLIDIDELCGVKAEKEVKEVTDSQRMELVKGVMLGIITCDGTTDTITQRLIKPIVSGEIKIESLTYTHSRMTVGNMKCLESGGLDAHINLISKITGLDSRIVSKLSSNDYKIASATILFIQG